MEENKRDYDPKERICQQIELLAEVSQDKDITPELIIQCSEAMANLYKALFF